MKNSIFQSKYIYFISGIITLIFLYLCLSSFKGGFLFPPLSKIFKCSFNLIVKENILYLYFKTLISVFVNIIICFIISILIAFINLYLKNINNLFTPFVVFLKSAPLSILIVYFFFLFGRKSGPSIICFMVIFPIIYESIFTSLKEIDKGIELELAVTNVSKAKKFYKIYLPLIMPYLAMSLLMCIGFGVKITIMGEYLMGTPNSLGLFIYNTKTYIEIDTLLALLFICVFLTLIIEVVARVIIRVIRRKIY